MNVLTRRGEIDRLFAEGTRAAGSALLLIALPTPEARDQSGRVLFVAGKRLGTAVLRNRAKRVLRAAAMRTGAPWPGWDIALVARPATHRTAPRELDESIRRGLVRLGVLHA